MQLHSSQSSIYYCTMYTYTYMYTLCTMRALCTWDLGGAMAKNVLTIHVRHVYIDEEDISVNKEEISCSRD